MQKITLQISCNDQQGIIASVTGCIQSYQGNIMYINQHVDQIENRFNMEWNTYSPKDKQKMALFVSKYDHCLYDLLGRYHSGELNIKIPFIISNHNDLKHIANRFEIPFYYIPITKDNKTKAEELQLELLEKYNIDFIVLARYMQIISTQLISKFKNRIINIYHSFLPAFTGAKPYHSAFKRGVKIIGATSHYVTEYLDEGPIIEQDIVRVSHIHTISDLILKGRDLEKNVLSRAIKLHLEKKTMVHDNKTIIFS